MAEIQGIKRGNGFKDIVGQRFCWIWGILRAVLRLTELTMTGITSAETVSGLPYCNKQEIRQPISDMPPVG